MKPGLPVSALALMAMGLFACPAPRQQPDAQPEGIPAEERFGNDPELLADFHNLKACGYTRGRLDHACPQVLALKMRLEVKQRTASRRKKMITTLANLLESRKELSRLMAAESLYPVRREPPVVAALSAALIRESVPGIKAVMLRQLCWTPGPRTEKLALALLPAANPAVVRARAAACLGHAPTLSAAGRKALIKALSSARAPRVVGHACVALGRHRVAGAVAPMAGLLEQQTLGWRCAPALAAVGGEAAYRALLKATAAALNRGQLPAPYVLALGSFGGQEYFDRPAVLRLLERIQKNDKLNAVSRNHAAGEIARLQGAARPRP